MVCFCLFVINQSISIVYFKIQLWLHISTKVWELAGYQDKDKVDLYRLTSPMTYMTQYNKRYILSTFWKHWSDTFGNAKFTKSIIISFYFQTILVITSEWTWPTRCTFCYWVTYDYILCNGMFLFTCLFVTVHFY